MAKLISLWLVMDVMSIDKRVGRHNDFFELTGNIVRSNIIKTDQFTITVLEKYTKCIKLGYRVKLTYFTTDEKFKKMQANKIAFAEDGLKYEIFNSEGTWDLLYENMK